MAQISGDMRIVPVCVPVCVPEPVPRIIMGNHTFSRKYEMIRTFDVG